MSEQTKRPLFKDFTPAQAKATVEEAMAEIEREANVRIKCFDRWVSEGKLAYVDARDRMNRICAAWNYLAKLADAAPTPQDDVPF